MSIKLNLGCGGEIMVGWVNIDLFVKHPEIVALDACDLPYQPGTVDEIRAYDVLEHISHRQVEAVLRSWCGLLRKGGLLTIRTPDAKKQAELLCSGAWPPETFSYMVYGGQDSEGNYHKCCFTMESLCAHLIKNGMTLGERAFLHTSIHPEIARSSNPNLLVVANKL